MVGQNVLPLFVACVYLIFVCTLLVVVSYLLYAQQYCSTLSCMHSTIYIYIYVVHLFMHGRFHCLVLNSRTWTRQFIREILVKDRGGSVEITRHEGRRTDGHCLETDSGRTSRWPSLTLLDTFA